jgi:hypothetical protein
LAAYNDTPVKEKISNKNIRIIAKLRIRIKVQDTRYKAQDTWYKTQDTGHRIQGAGFNLLYWSLSSRVSVFGSWPLCLDPCVLVVVSTSYLCPAMKKSELINDLIRTRRSVFTQQFEPGKIIPDEIIWQALENANWAPNHKFTEPWRFTVFTGNGLQKLAEQQAEVYKNFAGPKFKQNKYEQMLVTPQQC